MREKDLALCVDDGGPRLRVDGEVMDASASPDQIIVQKLCKYIHHPEYSTVRTRVQAQTMAMESGTVMGSVLVKCKLGACH